MGRRVSAHGYGFMQKPFTPEMMARRVRDVTDRGARGDARNASPGAR